VPGKVRREALRKGGIVVNYQDPGLGVHSISPVGGAAGT